VSNETLTTIIVALVFYAVAQTFVAYQYETHNDSLNFALGRCIGVNSMKRNKP
jgi:hypothetical protein